MKFYDYPDVYPVFQKMMPGLTRDQMYSALVRMQNDCDDPIGRAHLGFELTWTQAKKPFYRVWPKIIPMLTRLDVKQVPADTCNLPNGLNSLLVQLPHGNGLAEDGRDLHCFIVCKMQTSQGFGVCIGAIDGKLENGLPLVDVWLFPYSSKPLATVLDSLPPTPGKPVNLAIRDTVTSLVATLCLLQNDPELISPVLLAKDELRLDLTEEDIARLTDKAKRRGRFGFDIGKHIEVMPHYRRPHPALVWTGEGRKIPKIILRKGALVHRNKVASIPTGYLEND